LRLRCFRYCSGILISTMQLKGLRSLSSSLSRGLLNHRSYGISKLI